MRHLTVTGLITLPQDQSPDPDFIYPVENAPMPPVTDPEKAPEGLFLPQGGLTLIYGMSSAMDDLALTQAVVRQQGRRPIPVSVELRRIGRHSTYKLDELPKVRMLHLDRLSRDLLTLVVSHLEQFAIEEGKPFPWPEKRRSYQALDIIKYRPHLLSRLHSLPEFQHIEMMVYPVAAPDHRLFKRLTLFSKAPVLSVQAVYGRPLKVKLPDFLPD